MLVCFQNNLVRKVQIKTFNYPQCNSGTNQHAHQSLIYFVHLTMLTLCIDLWAINATFTHECRDSFMDSHWINTFYWKTFWRRQCTTEMNERSWFYRQQTDNLRQSSELHSWVRLAGSSAHNVWGSATEPSLVWHVCVCDCIPPPQVTEQLPQSDVYCHVAVKEQ